MNSKNIKQNINFFSAALLILSIGLYLSFFFIALNKPLQADETYFAIEAGEPGYGSTFSMYSEEDSRKIQGRPAHPPLYMDTLRILFRSGLKGKYLRLLGLVCYLLTLRLIYLICKQISDYYNIDNNIWLLSIFIYSIHPMIIQGSSILDIDNTILSLLITFFIYYFIKIRDNLDIKGYIILGFLFFTCLWCKLSTPFALIPSIFFFYLMNKNIRKGFLASLIIGGIGAMLFLIFWFGCAKINGVPFFFLANRVNGPIIDSIHKLLSHYFFRDLIKRVIRISFWFSPFFLILAVLALFNKMKRSISLEKVSDPSYFYFSYSIIVFLGYTLVIGTIWSFPKYHFPLLPILSILISELICLNFSKVGIKKTTIYIILIMCFIIFYMVFVGDLIYAFNFNLRNLYILSDNNLHKALNKYIFHVCMYFLPFLLSMFIIRRLNRSYNILRIVIASLLISLVSSLLYIDIIQARSAYSTTYCYGRSIENMEKLKVLVSDIKKSNPKGIIIAPADIYYHAGLGLPEYYYSKIGKTKDRFLEAINNDKVVCVIYGLSWNSTNSYRKIFLDKDVKGLLYKNYKNMELGEYSIWYKDGVL